MIEDDIDLPAGGTLHVYDSGPADPAATTVIWHHGTPNIGTPPAPLADTSARLGIRWLSFDRPGYGASSPQPGRSIADAARWAAAVADHAGIDRFAVMGHSGGGPHALACSALLAGRVSAAVTLAALAPTDAPGLDWFHGMHPSAAASLQAAQRGRAIKETFQAGAGFDPEVFTAADHDALATDWSWLEDVVAPAVEAGPGPLIDDDLAYVGDWGFGLSTAGGPTLIMHGEQDRMIPAAHGRWLARTVAAEHRSYPADGHISVLRHAETALSWLVENAAA